MTMTAAHQDVKNTEDEQTPGYSARTALVKARHSCGYDHSIVCQANYQQDQNDHDLPQEFEELAKLEDIAICAVGHLDVFLVEQGRHVGVTGHTLRSHLPGQLAGTTQLLKQ